MALTQQIILLCLIIFCPCVQAQEGLAVPAGWTTKGTNAQGFVELVNPRDGSVLIYIPAGAFLCGDHKEQRFLAGYLIGKYEITWRQYAAFCRASGRTMPERPDHTGDDHPVVNVDHVEANAYCGWAEATLPSEWQWEKAARGTDGRLYPWGDTFNWRLCNSAGWWIKREVTSENFYEAFFEGYLLPKDGPTLTLPVGSFVDGASPYGALDMAGNVREWCDDLYDPDSHQRVIRGGCWYDKAENCRASVRGHTYGARPRFPTLGFRLARSLP